jgi:hypothetical protein
MINIEGSGRASAMIHITDANGAFVSPKIVRVMRTRVPDADGVQCHPMQNISIVDCAIETIIDDISGGLPRRSFLTGLPVETDRDLPEDEIHFMQRGEIVGKIINLAKPGALTK